MSTRMQVIARHLHAGLLALLVRVEAELEARAALNSVIASASGGRLELGVAQGRALLADLRERSGTALAGRQQHHATKRDDPVELALRSKAEAASIELPLCSLSDALALAPDERQALLLALAPELDGRWGQLFGWLHDDLGRRRPSVELCARIIHVDEGARLDLIRRLGPWGSLRRCAVLLADHDGGLEPSVAARELLLGGNSGLVRRFFDPERVELDRPTPIAFAEQGEAWAAVLGRSARASEPAPVVVLFGGDPSARTDAAAYLARSAGLELHQLELDGRGPALIDRLRAALSRSVAVGALAWIDLDRLASFGPSDGGDESSSGNSLDQLHELHELIVAELLRFAAPIIVSTTQPWRPLALTSRRTVIERELPPLAAGQRADLWARLLPELDPTRARALVEQLPLGELELRAVAVQLLGRRQALANGKRPTIEELLPAALRTVTLRTTHRYATIVEPRRGPKDLILPAPLYARVLEVAAFARVRGEVDREWGLGRMMTGTGGVRALFCGESGTGKTLAAEVIAGLLGMTMLRIDLARVISKWVGETEKQLERAFAEALDAHALLVFDEGDALFGKRAEVRQGQDRWANLEVSYLLQRIEDHAGPIILASNLRENIDAAFTRRFQIVVHFPRPELPERRRIWSLALPDGVPLSADVELDRLATIELTGAGIVDAARTAAMLARSRAADAIATADLVDGIARVFEREGRLFSPDGWRSDPKREPRPRSLRGAR